MALNKARSEASSPGTATAQPLSAVEPTSSGISTAINVHPPKTPSSVEDRDALLRSLSTSSSSTSVSSGFGGHGGPESSSSGALGLEGTGVTLGPVIGGGGASGGGKGSVRGRRVPKGLCELIIHPAVSASRQTTLLARPYHL